MEHLNQDQIDRYNAFEAMLDMMEDGVGYTKAEIQATIDQIVEMAVEDREETPAFPNLDKAIWSATKKWFNGLSDDVDWSELEEHERAEARVMYLETL